MSSNAMSGIRFSWLSPLLIFLLLWGVCVLGVFSLNEYRYEPPAWIEECLQEHKTDVKEKVVAEEEVYSNESFAFVLLDKADNDMPCGVDKYLTKLKTFSNILGMPVSDGKSGDKKKSAANAQQNQKKSRLQSARLYRREQVDIASGVSFPKDALRTDIVTGVDDKGVAAATMPHGQYVIQIKAQEPIVHKGETLAYWHADGLGKGTWVYNPGFYHLMAYWQYCQLCKGNPLEMWGDLVYTGILCALMIFGFKYILAFLRNDHAEFPAKILLLCGICHCFHILSIWGCGVFFHRHHLGLNYYLFAMVPAALGPSLCSNLLGRRVGVASAVLLSALASVLIGDGFEFQLFVQSVTCSLAGVFVFQKLQYRRQFLLGGCLIVLTMMLLSLFFCLQQDQLHYFLENEFVVRLLLLSFANAVIVIFGMLLFPAIFEWCFDVTTVFTLNELNNVDHALMKRLKEEAAGTFEHSTIVARMAGDAAMCAGLNAKLAFACGFFHDIGKLFAPKKFAENLLSGEENPHDVLKPQESCSLLREHIRYGEVLAKRYHLPGVVREAIRQHHGTGVMRGFYIQACNDAEGNGLPVPNVKEYSYTNGQCPIRAEVVLVAIADSCEAAVRAMVQHTVDPSSELIRSRVEEIIREKFVTHQFDDAHLTLEKFHLAIERMIAMLCVIHHVRPEYPQKTVVTDEGH